MRQVQFYDSLEEVIVICESYQFYALKNLSEVIGFTMVYVIIEGNVFFSGRMQYLLRKSSTPWHHY